MRVLDDWRSWPEFLLQTFKLYRFYPGWADLYELHDEEDGRYLMMLENEMETGNIKPDGYPPDDYPPDKFDKKGGCVQ